MFDIVAPFPLLSQAKARGWRAFGPEGGCLLGIIRAESPCDGAGSAGAPAGGGSRPVRRGSQPHTPPFARGEREFTHAWGHNTNTRAVKVGECGPVTRWGDQGPVQLTPA